MQTKHQFGFGKPIQSHILCTEAEWTCNKMHSWHSKLSFEENKFTRLNHKIAAQSFNHPLKFIATNSGRVLTYNANRKLEDSTDMDRTKETKRQYLRKQSEEQLQMKKTATTISISPETSLIWTFASLILMIRLFFLILLQIRSSPSMNCFRIFFSFELDCVCCCCYFWCESRECRNRFKGWCLRWIRFELLLGCLWWRWRSEQLCDAKVVGVIGGAWELSGAWLWKIWSGFWWWLKVEDMVVRGCWRRNQVVFWWLGWLKVVEEVVMVEREG
jgi:hypothetical protein